MTDPSLKKTTILLLVRDATVLSVMEEILKSGGYSVVGAADLGIAMDRLKEVTPDLLIARSYLQSLTGVDATQHLHAARTLQAKCKTMKVLLVGGVLDDGRIFRSGTLQGFEVFPKPYSAADFLGKVEEVLSVSRKPDANSSLPNR